MPAASRWSTALLGLCLWACLPAKGPPAADAGRQDAGQSDAGEPITAAAETWTYVHFPDAHCGNGTETGIGVNLEPGARTLVLFLQGGGACWEASACYVVKSASHVEDTVQSQVVLAEAQDPSLRPLFDRADAANPLRGAHQVYMPYCTGDLHAGTHVQHYELLGQSRDLHHVGAQNQDAFLRRLVPTFSQVDRVILAGLSAGGYGTQLNAWRVQRAFGPGVRVDLLDDSGIPVAMESSRFGTAMAAWLLEWPPGCADCPTQGFPALLPWNAHLLPAPSRQALLANRQDGTIALYFGLSGAEVQSGLDQLQAVAAANQRFYLLDGTAHVVLANPQQATSTGVVALDWLHQFELDGGTFSSAGP